MTVTIHQPMSLRISRELHAKLSLEAATMKGTLTDAAIRRLKIYFGGEAPGPKKMDDEARHFAVLCRAKERATKATTEALVKHVDWLTDYARDASGSHQKNCGEELAIFMEELRGREGEKIAPCKPLDLYIP